MQTPSQWQLLKQDKWLLSCLTWIPLVLVATIWGIFSQHTAHQLPIGAVDLSHSTLSRQLLRDVNATAAVQLDYQFADATAAMQAMKQGAIYGYIVINKDFEASIYRGKPAQVSVFYNSQYMLTGKLINSAIIQAQSVFNAKIEVMKNLSQGDTSPRSAMAIAVPVRAQMTALFNKNANYSQFLVSAVTPALWQIFIVLSTILILAAHMRIYGLSYWLGLQPFYVVVKTLSLYLPLFMLQGLAFLVWFYGWLRWPLNGDVLTIVVAQFFMIVSCMIIGAFFFFLTTDAARALSFAGAFTAPSFAFMGITFPVTDMNVLAQTWRSLLPVSHYIEVQLEQANYGLEPIQSLLHLLPMAGYLLPLLLVYRLIHKHVKAARSLDGMTGHL